MAGAGEVLGAYTFSPTYTYYTYTVTISLTTLREAAEAMIEGAKAGTVKSKKGQPFKPSTVRSYQDSLELHVLPDYGWVRLSAISRFDLQELVDRLDADGLDGATIRNAVTPLRVIYRRALARGEVALLPLETA